MNLVGGYGSSSSDDDESKEQEQQQAQPTLDVAPKGKGKAVLPARATVGVKQPTAGDTSMGKRKSSSTKKKKKKKNKVAASSKMKKKSKTVNALVLSPEIQAALARGDTLGDSDSDEDGPKKPPKIVRRPAGSNPNDLLSLLPQPSTAASADDILLKNKKRREEAKTAAKADAAAEAQPAASSSAAVPAPTSTAAPATAAGVGKVVEDEESDSDDDQDDLLAGMHAKAAAAAASGSDSGAAAISAPLFTLPSRAKQPPAAVAAVAAGSHLPDEGAEVAGVTQPLVGDTAVGAQHHVVAHQWGAADTCSQGGIGGAGYSGGAGAGASTQYVAYGDTSGQQLQQQHQQAQYYDPAAAEAVAGFGRASQHGASSYEAAEFGGGGKATRRKGRDMERALARGDLGALGSELPVMDLHQGDNEYTPLRTKPVTAAMKQEQKHIESSVYDPRSGKTVKTLEPTSTQKRKHQINQLAVQAASMERDLMERSGASRLTKAQTHAKYGW